MNHFLVFFFSLKILYIFRFQPQDIVLETKLKPFIPEYVPAIGDIDAFLKVFRIILFLK
jgi:hypothetical protein